MLLAKITAVLVLVSISGLVMTMAIAVARNGADIDRRQSKIDELRREQKERLKI